jgi:nucleotide-binding universal stress UspA family protein
VHILSVVDERTSGRAKPAAAAEAYVQTQSREMSDAGIAVRHEVAVGSPADVILARAADSELTVMTHRAGRWDFGGNLATVLREMRLPVIVVRPGAVETGGGLGHPTILAPLDQSAFSRTVLHAVEMLANSLGFRVVLCHVIKPFGPYMDPSQAPPGIASAIQEQMSAARCDLETEARNLSGTASSPDVVISMGDPSHEIVRIAERCQAGVIAMATRGSGRLSRVMGSAAHAVVQSTRLPCLLVRPEAEQAQTALQPEPGVATT